MIGLVVTKSALDNAIGELTRTLQQSFRQVEGLKYYIDNMTDQEVIEIGYTQSEVTAIRLAVSDLVQLGKIYNGNQPLANAKDFRVSIRKTWGLGAL